MRHFITFLCGITASVFSYCQAPLLQWSATYAGVDNVTAMKHIGVDGGGNVYTSGSMFNGSTNDYVVVKYNAAGVQQWVAIYDSGNQDELTQACVDPAGNVYLSGYGNAGGNYNFRTVKYNSAGLQQWVAVYNNPANRDDYVGSVAIDAAGNVYVTGYCDQGAGWYDMVTVKYNSVGAQQWATSYRYAINTYNIALDVVADAAGNVYTTGYSRTGGFYDIVTIKYNSLGVQQWASIYAGAGGLNDMPRDIAVDASGFVYVTGTSQNGLNNDAVTVKYNSSGIQQWATVYNGGNNDSPKAMELDGSGNVYIISESSISGVFRIITLKYNSAGVQQWISIYNGAGSLEETCQEMTINAAGNILVTGKSYFPATDADVLLLIYSPAGALLSNTTFTSSGVNTDEGRSVITDASDNIYINALTNNGSDYDMTVLKYIRNTKLYVDYTASGTNDGTSWTNAYTDLQSALTASLSGDTIFVASGTYKPDGAAPGNRSLSFNMKTGVVLVGGFPNGGSTLANRNWVANPTILSGDIGTVGVHTDNSYHVVRCAGQQGELNGFIVERGRADGAAPDNDGGGIFITSGYVVSRFCTFRNNYAGDQGGGSYHDAGGNPQYRQCKFENNTATSGGGSYAFASTVIANCSYIGNSATASGGGVYAVVNINMYNSTFRNNSAVTSGNAIYYQSGGSNRLYNSIVWGNTGSATHIAGAGSIELLSCIIQGGCPGGGATCTAILNVDPLFSDAAGHLNTTSPAIDAGNTSSPDFNSNSLTIDLDNNNRNFDAIPGGAVRDIGAYESQVLNLSRYYVDHTATGLNDGTSWVNAFTSFQSAVALATAGDTVLVAAGTHKPSVGPSRLKKYTLVNGVCYYGGFPNGGGTFASRDFNANRTILSGDIGTPVDSTDNCFVVVDASNLTNSTLMSGFTIEEGNADSTGINMYARAGGIQLGATGNMRLDSVTVRNNFGKNGSGIYAEGPVNWVIRGCIFDNNTNASAVYIGGNATGSMSNCTFNNNLGFNGGAISLNVLSATFSFTDCSFTNNRATASGGGGAINSGQTFGTYTNCTFTNNIALTGPGGALYKFYSSLNTFNNCTFTGNRCGQGMGGGALCSSQGGFAFNSCVFSQNMAIGTSTHGGAVYSNGGTSNAINCVFWSNTTTSGLGGAIYNNTGGNFTLMNCSFARNHAGGFTQGGGINNNSSSSATITNCIFWGNLANNNDVPANSEIGHGSGTLTVSNTIWQGNITGGTIYNVDPLFTNSVTGDLSLTICSPAIDTGTSSGAPVIDVVNFPRPFNAKPGTLNHDLGAFEFQSAVLIPEVNVTGNSVAIVDGDVTPSLGDHTNFGSQSVCNGTVVRTFTIENTGSANLTVATPTISGPHAADFTVTALPSSSVAFPASTTFQVTFNPSAAGIRNATITFTNNDCDEPTYDFAINGLGVVVTVSAASQTNVTCFGASTGAASVNASGGIGPLTFDWTPGTPTGDGTNAISAIPAGTWTCTVTDINGCTGSVAFNITSPGALAVTGTQTNVSCIGGSNGSASVSVSGGTPGYFYNWIPAGGNAATATGLPAGNYTCQIFDANTCSTTQTFNIGQPTAPVSGLTVETHVSCFGGSDGAIDLTPNGGTPGYTYLWLPSGPTTQDRTGLSVGTYSVQITDALGCTGTLTITLTQPVAPLSGSTVITHVSCFGGSNGTINLTPTGGTGPYTYAWTAGPTTEDRNGLAAGTYSVQITDLNSCTANITATVTEPPALVAASSATSVLCNGGSSTVTVTGSGGSPSYTGTGTFVVTAGTHTYTVTDANGCVATTTIAITQPNTLVASSSATSIACFGGNATVTVSATGGTFPYTGTGTFTVTAGTYTYTVADANGCTTTTSITVTEPAPLSAASTAFSVPCFGGVTTVTVTATGGTFPYSGTGTFTESAGTHSYIVTDANGCTTTTSITVLEPTLLVATLSGATNVTCNGGNNGSATVLASGGVPAYAYQWFPSGGTGPTANNLTPGCYTVVVTDVNGCTASAVTCITEPTALTASSSSTPVLCNGGTADVTISGAGGTAPYTGEGTFTTVAGTYTYTITDANGCSTTTSVTITEPTALAATSSATSIACFGGNATVTVAATGGTAPYTGEGTFTEVAGTYSYTVTDANGCSTTTSVTITEPTALAATSSATSIACFGGNATVTVAATGGTAPYTGEGTFTEVAGTYSYTVTDANGCSTTTSVTITEPTALAATSSATSIACFGGNATVTVAASGGTAPYTGEGTFTEVAGTYTYTVTDANGCTTTTSVTITEPAVLSAIVASVTDPSTCGGTDGAIDITPAGGTIPYTFLWSNGSLSEDPTGLNTGAYSCTITDVNGCTATTNASLNDPNAPTVTLTISSDTVCLADGAFTLTGESPIGGTFSGPGVSAGSFDPTTAGVGTHMISYTFTDINGCTGSTTDSVYVDICLGSQSIAPVSQFTVYPNPNNGTFTLQLINATTADVLVFDAQGKLVSTQQILSSSQQITVGESGIYLITVITSDGQRTTQRVIVTE